MKYIYKSNNQNYLSKYGELSSGYIEAKKSKFYCYIFNVDNQDVIDNYLNKIKEDNKTARHIVYLYSYADSNNNQIFKYTEDHEPQGTALKEIINIISKQNITNVLIVIVRYFGNILLGTGLLSRCYKNSYVNATSSLNKVILYECKTLEINIKYSYIDDVLNYIRKYNSNKSEPIVEILDIKYLDYINLKLNIQSQYYDEFNKNLGMLLKKNY